MLEDFRANVLNQLHLGSHFFHLLTPPRFSALNLPEVNQFTGNSFRVVRIVLKITFLKSRYPKGVTGRLLLCPIMALAIDYGSAFVLFYYHDICTKRDAPDKIKDSAFVPQEHQIRVRFHERDKGQIGP